MDQVKSILFISLMSFTDLWGIKQAGWMSEAPPPLNKDDFYSIIQFVRISIIDKDSSIDHLEEQMPATLIIN